jgi:hypothetical protein
MVMIVAMVMVYVAHYFDYSITICRCHYILLHKVDIHLLTEKQMQTRQTLMINKEVMPKEIV